MPNTIKFSFSSFIELIRVNQWVKNLFVFLPMFFNKQFMHFESFQSGCIAFFAFSLVASSNYCLNDVLDVEFDINHIQKRKRPIANGNVSKSTALLYMILLAFFGFIIAYIFNSIQLLYVLAVYFLINILYSIVLKKIMYLDIIIIAFSFVLRIIAGGVATETPLSYWIITLVILLSLFLSLAKRRDELLIYIESKAIVRKNINGYSLGEMNAILKVLALIVMCIYIAYTLSATVALQYKNRYVYLTSIFVVLGLLRYFKLIQKRFNYANPSKILLKDIIMQLIVLGWLISFYVIIYV